MHEIDLTYRNTLECRFLEYWEILKEEEGVTLKDVYSEDVRLKKGLNFKEKDPELLPSDSDLDTEDDNEMGKRKGSKKPEFIGWGSKPLIEFLTSLGKDTTNELSQIDVDSIICKYIQEKNLLDPAKKKKVLCDENLYSIFRRKSVNKNRIYSLLEAHFKESFEQSEEDDVDEKEKDVLGDKNENNMVKHKKQKAAILDEKPQEKEEKSEFQPSRFASIVADNIKLVYLRKSLLEELLKQKENFEYKVVGSFVKVKNDPRDYLHRNSHQLLQVSGIKRTSTAGEMKNETILQVSSIPSDVCISRLSDSEITEEEIEDLREKVKNGQLKKPTVVEFEKKAKILHEDITKQWIARELITLQNRIDCANLKGWRRELSEYLDQRELLKKPSEQERLVQQLPKVIAEVVEIKPASTDYSENNEQSGDGLRLSTVEGDYK